MLISEEQLERALAGSKSIREAWRKFSVEYYPVAWDTFRKNVHSYNETAKYFDGKTYNEKKVWPKYGLALYDMHVPHHDETVLDLAKNYVSYHLGFKKLDYLILGGDFLTCDAVGKWSNDPSKTMPLNEEIDYATDVLSYLRKEFSPQKMIYVKGNHEARLERYIWSKAPELCQVRGLTIQEQLNLGEMGIEWVDNLARAEDGLPFYSIGQLVLAHGHEFKCAPQISPARQYFLKSFAPLLVGHVHRIDEHFTRTVEGKLLGTWCCGCSCNLHPNYLPCNQWVQGFALITFFENGLFEVQNKKIINGMVL